MDSYSAKKRFSMLLTAIVFAVYALLFVSVDDSTSHEIAHATTTTSTSTSTTVAPTTTTIPPRVTTPRASRHLSAPRGYIYDRLGVCESGTNPPNPRAVSKTGKYRGAFQFSMETYHAIGGVGDPIDAPYEVQRQLVIDHMPISSWHSQFPVCSRKLGV